MYEAVKYNDKSKSVITNVASSAVQRVPILASQHYRIIIIARCYKQKTQGRIQVNWSDANGQFISPDFQVFECSPEWQEHFMEIIAPNNVAIATVYAIGHTEISLEFQSVSFKR